jgi:hypothetical protein
MKALPRVDAAEPVVGAGPLEEGPRDALGETVAGERHHRHVEGRVGVPERVVVLRRVAHPLQVPLELLELEVRGPDRRVGGHHRLELGPDDAQLVQDAAGVVVLDQ